MGNRPEPSKSPLHEPLHASIDTTPSAQATAENGTHTLMTLDHKNDAAAAPKSKELNQSTSGIIVEGHQAEEHRPPLPPRPSLLQTSDRPATPLSTNRRPTLQSKPTTAISSVDIQTLSFPDGSRGTFSTPGSRSVSESISGLSGGQSTPNRKASRNSSEFDDNVSLMSYAPTLRANGDLASLLDEGLNSQSPAWKLLSSQADTTNPFETIEFEDPLLTNFDHEFDEVPAVDSNGGNEG
jgi:hypothetical protein